MLLTVVLAKGHEKHSGEGEEDEERGLDAVKVSGISSEQREPDEDEEQMRAEDLERGLSQGKEWLNGDDALDDAARSIKEDGEGRQVEQAKRADLPFIELEAEELRGEMRPEPGVSYAHEEEADSCADEVDGARKPVEGPVAVGDGGPDPETESPDELPGEEIECAGLLQGDMKMRGSNDEIVDPGSEAKLGQQPDAAAGGEDPAPASARREDKQGWRGDHEDDVHGQDIEQRRAVNQQQGRDNRRERMREVIVQQIDKRGPMGVRGYRCRDGERKQQHKKVIAIDAKATLPDLVAHLLRVVCRTANGKHREEKSGEKDESLGRGDEADGLVEVVAQVRGKVVEGHPDQEEPAQRIQLGAAL